MRNDSDEASGLSNPNGLTVRCFQASDEEAVVMLWERCNLTSASNDPHKDIARKLNAQPELFLVALNGEQIVGSVMAGYEGHRGWINYLAVAPQFQAKGIGRRLMHEAESRLLALGCPKINLQVRSSNKNVIEFYRHIDFLQDDVVSFGKRLISDEETNK